MFNFSNEQIERYSRHIILKEVGGLGQTKLLESKILVIGAGGLGSPTALYLAAAGVGTLGIIDHDTVDVSNLQRQILHGTSDVGQPKVVSAKATLNEINPDVEIVMYQQRLSSENVFQLFEDYDLVIDGCDNFPTRYLINDACVMQKKPFSHGGILRFEGQTFTHTPGNACYRCLFKEPPPKNAVPTCSQAGILGAVAGMLGTVQAAEALKYLIGIGDLLKNRLLIFDALKMEYRTVKIKKSKTCPICGDKPTIKKLIDYEQAACDL